MPQFCDPKKTKFFPETVIEAIDAASITTGGESVAKYTCSPYHTIIENIHIDPIHDMDVFLGIDGVAEKMQYRSNCVNPIGVSAGEDFWKKEKFVATKTIEFMYRMAAGAATHAYGRWNITTKTPSIIDKLRANQRLTSEEQQIADNLDLEDNLAVGSLPQASSLIDRKTVWPLFSSIEPIYREVAAFGANTSNIIGYEINCPQNMVGVLLGVMVDPTWIGHFSDTYLTVDRDNDYDYMKLDCSAMPIHMATSVGETVPCFVPFIDKLVVSLDSITGSGDAGVKCGFIIGMRPRTLLDHIKWGSNLPYRSNVEETESSQLIDKYTKGLGPRENILNRIKAGLL